MVKRVDLPQSNKTNSTTINFSNLYSKDLETHQLDIFSNFIIIYETYTSI